MIKKDPAEVWEEYNTGVAYKQKINLYEDVKQNENFFIGKQWEGVNAPDLDKPVINILKRVVAYFLSTIVSDDVTAQVTTFDGDSEQDNPVLNMISDQLDRAIELTGFKTKNRDVLRNAAVDGDGCVYIRFDPSIKTGQLTEGEIDVEIIDNTNVIFGNVLHTDVQKQPYILLVLRKSVDSVREEARASGLSDEEIENIRPDNEENVITEDNGNDKVTVLLKLWRDTDTETIHMMKLTKSVVIRPEIDTEYRRYPLAWLSWDKVKNSYHGQAAITGLIPNQIFINKLFAMSMRHVSMMAFPKMIVNSDVIDGRWSNRVGETITVHGDPNQAIATGYKPPDMSNQVMALIESAIQYTRDTMGASDAALGNIKPDNTSAIIAVQKSSAMPLELQRMSFYQYVEDCVRIFLDIMSVNYGVRSVNMTDENGNKQTVVFDFDALRGMNLKLNVDVGASTYWSELMQVQTIDNLFSKGIISDAVTYLESIPDGYIRNKAKIIADIKEKQALMSMMGGGNLGTMPEMQNTAAYPTAANGG